MKKVLSVLHTCDEKLGSFFSGTAVGQIIIAIILAAAVACASSIADGLKAEYAERDFYNEIAIANSQVYIEDAIGHPRYVSLYTDTNITDAKYFTKHGMIRVFYKDGSVIAYFITSKDRSYKHIELPEYCGTGGKPLGSFTYDMVEGTLDNVAYDQGSYDLEVYFEQYRFDGDRERNYHYFMYVDKYGFEKNEFLPEDQTPDRSKSYPNTYGVCTMEDTLEVENYILHTINY